MRIDGMDYYRVHVLSDGGEEWWFCCHADDVKHATEQALNEPSVRRVLEVLRVKEEEL